LQSPPLLLPPPLPLLLLLLRVSRAPPSDTLGGVGTSLKLRRALLMDSIDSPLPQLLLLLATTASAARSPAGAAADRGVSWGCCWVLLMLLLV
jgi:hypothetical protein